MHDQRVHGHDPTQVHLHPPVFHRVVGIGLPVCRWVTVQNVGRRRRIRSHPADSGSQEKGVDRECLSLLRHRDEVALHVIRDGTVDVQDARLPLPELETRQWPGKCIEVIEQIVAVAGEVWLQSSARSYIHRTLRQVPIVPVRRTCDGDLGCRNPVPALGRRLARR